MQVFKSEWSTVKGDHLWVGGLGKEWTTPDGKVLNTHPMFVKKISKNGEVCCNSAFDNTEQIKYLTSNAKIE